MTTDEARKELNDFRSLVISHKRDDEKIILLEAQINYSGMVLINTGSCGNGGRINTRELQLAQLIDLKHLYQSFYLDHATQLLSIEQRLKQVESISSKHANILRAFYLDGVPLKDLCIKFDYSYSRIKQLVGEGVNLYASVKNEDRPNYT